MAVIDSFRGIITIFVEFQTPEGDGEKLLGKLKDIYNSQAKGRPGLVSVNYHIALDGKSLHNYAQWKTEEDFDNFLSDPEVQKSMSSLSNYSSKFTKTKVVFTS